MKRLIIISAIIAFFGSAANAQLSFQSGIITFGYSPDVVFGDADNLSITAQGDYNIGQLGLQLDGAADVITDFNDFFAEYSVGAHVYKELENGAKAGGFVNVDYLAVFFINEALVNVGIEGIVSFGALDVEASVGWLTVTNQADGFGAATLDAFYSIAPAIELSAGAYVVFDSGNSFASYRVGAYYMLANLPISIGANYYFSEINESVELVASYSFGAPGDERLFSSRAYPLFTVGG